MLVIFVGLLALFVAKLVWNVGVAVALWLRSRRSSSKGGISLMPWLECALLILAAVAAAMFDAPLSVSWLVILGSISIVASYALMFVLGMLLGWRSRSPD